MNRPRISDIKSEVLVTTARSGGPGGQHVNKVETKVVLRWSLKDSAKVSELQKEMIRAANKSKITKDDEIVITADSKRSQVKNKEIAFKKLDRLLAKAFIPKKKRISTKPTKSSRKKRLDQKKKHSEKKSMRKRIL